MMYPNKIRKFLQLILIVALLGPNSPAMCADFEEGNENWALLTSFFQNPSATIYEFYTFLRYGMDFKDVFPDLGNLFERPPLAPDEKENHDQH